MKLYLVIFPNGDTQFRSSRAHRQTIRRAERLKNREPRIDVVQLDPQAVRLALESHDARVRAGR